VKVPSLVRAALGAAPLLLGCRVPQGPGVQSLGAAALPPPADGRESRASYRLPNGLSVVLEENHVTPVVAAQVWVRAGAADAPGVAHVVERALLDGVRSPEGLGAPLASWTSPDATVFEAVVAAPFVGAALEALGAVLGHGPLEVAAFERARAVAVEERRAAGVEPSATAVAALFGAAFGAHGYGRGVLADDATLRALTCEQANAFHRRAYAGENATLVVTGDFDAAAVRARLATAFAAVPAAETERAPGAPLPALAGPVAVVAAGQGGVAHVVLGFRLPAFSAYDAEAADLLAAALAGDDDGILPRAVVRNRQLATKVATSVFVGRDAGMLLVDASAATGTVDELVRALIAATAGLARDPLARDELERARSRVAAAYARREETSDARARRLGFLATVAGDVSRVDRHAARLRALGASDLRAAAAELLSPRALTLAALVPPSSAPGRAPRQTEAHLVALATAATTAAAARAPTPGDGATVTTAADIVRVALPSGTRVLFLRDRSATSVSIVAHWRGGLRFEDARSNGATAMLAALLPRGTRTRDAARLAAELDGAGGTLTGLAGRDELGVRLEVLADGWERGLELLTDCVLHPAFADEEVERARRALIERVRAREDDAAAVADRLLLETLFPAQPYRLPPLGTADSLSALARGRLAEHYRRYYGASNLTLAIVGDVDVQRAIARLGTLLAGAPAVAAIEAPTPLPVTAPAAATPEPETAPLPLEVFRLAPKDDAHVVVGFPGVALRDPDRAAVELLARALDADGGPLARDAGASDVRVSVWSGVDGGAFTIDLAGAPRALDAAVPGVRGALARLVVAGIAPAALERARRAAVAAHAGALGRRADVALALARDEAFGLPTGATRARASAFAAVTPEALARVARRVLDPQREVVAAVRPPAAPPAPPPAAVAQRLSKVPPKVAPTPVPSGGRRAPAP
jgi:zinc protease